MAKLFVIRDDDLNYFSQPADIEKYYADIFAQKIPVSFAVIPFTRGSSDVYTGQAEKNNAEYPFDRNVQLIEYLKKNSGTVEIMQHGCTHETKNGVYEFAGDSGDLFEEARRGHEHLKNVFGEVKTFVAPHDSISNHGILAVESIGLDIIRSKGFRNFLRRREYFFGIIKMIAHRLKHPNLLLAPAYPHTINLGKHKEAYSHRITKNKKLIKKWLDFSARRNGNFVIVNHLHVYDEETKNALVFAIDEAKKDGFLFAKASALFC